MKTLLLPCLLATFITAGSVQAETGPSFSLDYSAIHATHIVVVDQKGTVLESWRGDLNPGKKLPFPANPKPIPVDYNLNFNLDEYPDGPEIFKKTVKSVTGNRRILFLIQVNNDKEWAPANVNQPNIDLATVWIEQGQGSAIYQFINNESLGTMHPLYLTEAAIKRQISVIADAAAAKTKARLKPPVTANPKPPAKPADDIAGNWRVFLPGGFEYQITLTREKGNRYRLAPGNLTFSGEYELQENCLVSVQARGEQVGGFHWTMNSPYFLTLTKQTASVGSDYTGAVLFRQREDIPSRE